VGYSPDGKWVATGGGPGQVKIWSTADGRLLSALKERVEGGIESLAISRDGRWLAAGGDSYTVKLWKLRDEVPDDSRRYSTKAVTLIGFPPLRPEKSLFMELLPCTENRLATTTV
jgi:WD40 repeat protein